MIPTPIFSSLPPSLPPTPLLPLLLHHSFHAPSEERVRLRLGQQRVEFAGFKPVFVGDFFGLQWEFKAHVLDLAVKHGEDGGVRGAHWQGVHIEFLF